ncbi:MAG: hypothetical protein BWY47_02077 [Bacteroidetes bacterium ADurb.Bin302]|nr:MAG: hypothetical protein BWY47_02077 [Bacteroidetes bacterium ADurb.Bin302]
MYVVLNFSEDNQFLELRVKNIKGKPYIFDACRMKWVAATPEEKVRQGFCAYLIDSLNYPAVCINNECIVEINGLKQRCDTLVYKQMTPIMLVEYKAPSVIIDKSVFEQVMRYNSQFHVPYIVVTNQSQTYCCKMDYDNMSYDFIKEIPMWSDL